MSVVSRISMLAILLVLLMGAVVADNGYSVEAMAPVATPAACAVTAPNGLQPPPRGNAFGAGNGDYGNASLWTSLWIWGEGAVYVDVGHRNAVGEAEDMKWAWYRFVPGKLTIDGRRLDADAPPLRANVPEGYGGSGFVATGLTFPTAGCWEVTGHLGDATLTFVVFVVYLGAGTPFPQIEQPALSV